MQVGIQVTHSFEIIIFSDFFFDWGGLAQFSTGNLGNVNARQMFTLTKLW